MDCRKKRDKNSCEYHNNGNQIDIVPEAWEVTPDCCTVSQLPIFIMKEVETEGYKNWSNDISFTFNLNSFLFTIHFFKVKYCIVVEEKKEKNVWNK